ncbi:expressed unknown protein [Seminavis robusta]|uniref:Uncharacterized protein n=1 Tax=Seminavis robusta TaxID=568900 RepID=A0A9N8DI36_9STRA|nr:expressed unknown protein [Seminavis robusta]|eukprot:Sro98_g050550.1 n/a (465) ;mRNA; r:82773-84167
MMDFRIILRNKKQGNHQKQPTTLKVCLNRGDFSTASHSLQRPRGIFRQKRAITSVHIEEVGTDDSHFVPQQVLACSTYLSETAPKLQHLTLEDVTLSTIAALSTMVVPLVHLTTLTLQRVHFHGEDVRKDDTITTRSSVETIILESCEFTNCSLDDVLGGATKGGSLTKLVIRDTPISDGNLESINKKLNPNNPLSNLEDLEITDMGSSPNLNDSITAMAKDLMKETIRAPQRIKLSGSFWGPSSCLAWASMLQKNTTIRHLSLGGIDWKDYGTPLAQSLQHNQTLLTLELDNRTTYHDSDNDSFRQQVTPLVLALAKENRSLQELHLKWPFVSPSMVRRVCTQPMIDMLRENPVLRHLTLDGTGTLTSLEMNFYLHLNRRGIRHYHDNNGMIYQLLRYHKESDEDDLEFLSTIFVLILSNPTALSNAVVSGQEKRVTRPLSEKRNGLGWLRNKLRAREQAIQG